MRGALEANERLRQRGETRGNAGDQLQAVMAEVTRLNTEGRVDEADGLFDVEEQRMKAAHRADKERQGAEATALLDRRLDQDRLRDDPQAAAKRLIRDLHRQAPPGGVWLGTRDLLHEWRDSGERQGNPFDLRVALTLAKANHAKSKGPMRCVALTDLCICQSAIGERASNDDNLRAAETTFRARLRQSLKRKDPQTWAAAKINLGIALSLLGTRAQDDDLLRDAVGALQDALTIRTKEATPVDWARAKASLGVTLLKLGERAQDDALLRDAVAAHEDALTIWTREVAPTEWASSQNNLGLALRWRGAVKQEVGYFDDAEPAYLRCLEERRWDTVPFLWAITQWNLGDLALTRFAVEPDAALLDTAERHVGDARAVFAEGSDHQTARCDELLRKIAEARRSV